MRAKAKARRTKECTILIGIVTIQKTQKPEFASWKAKNRNTPEVKQTHNQLVFAFTSTGRYSNTITFIHL
jgi:hypothetical protein